MRRELSAGIAIGERLGLKITADAAAFSPGLSAGSAIANLKDPFAGMGLGTTTWATFGTVPGQLSLSGSQIQQGASSAVQGTSYGLGILATSGDGKQKLGYTLSFLCQPTLQAIGVSSLAATQGTPDSVSITGKTTGSTIDPTATASDGSAWTISGTTLSGTFIGSGSITLPLVERLAGASNSPRTTVLTFTVTASGGGAGGSGGTLDLSTPSAVTGLISIF